MHPVSFADSLYIVQAVSPAISLLTVALLKETADPFIFNFSRLVPHFDLDPGRGFPDHHEQPVTIL